MHRIALFMLVMMTPVAVLAQKADPDDKAFSAFEVYDAAFDGYIQCLDGQGADIAEKRPQRDCTKQHAHLEKAEAAFRKELSAARNARKK